MTRKQKIFTIISVLVIVLAIMIFSLISKKPKVVEKPSEPRKTAVNVISVSRGSFVPHISVLGKVEAESKVDITPEVSGKIVAVNKNFVPGGFIKKGAMILKIDQSKYINALNKAKSNYIIAKEAYRESLGEQRQAREELKIYEKNTGKKVRNPSLALKKPLVAKSLASLKQAKAELDDAKINLKDTVVKAPYNIIVYDKKVDTGDYVTPGAPIATMVNTDRYWINASMPVKDLSLLDFVNHNNKVTLKLTDGRGERQASFFKTVDFLDAKARFIGVLFVVKDPLLLKSKNRKSFLLLDDYVNVDIAGKPIENVFRIPLFALKNDNVVWLYNNGVLRLAKVSVAFQDDNYAYVTGLQNGDRVIVSGLTIVAPGMLLKIVKNVE